MKGPVRVTSEPPMVVVVDEGTVQTDWRGWRMLLAIGEAVMVATRAAMVKVRRIL